MLKIVHIWRIRESLSLVIYTPAPPESIFSQMREHASLILIGNPCNAMVSNSHWTNRNVCFGTHKKLIEKWVPINVVLAITNYLYEIGWAKKKYQMTKSKKQYWYWGEVLPIDFIPDKYKITPFPTFFLHCDFSI